MYACNTLSVATTIMERNCYEFIFTVSIFWPFGDTLWRTFVNRTKREILGKMSSIQPNQKNQYEPSQMFQFCPSKGWWVYRRCKPQVNYIILHFEYTLYVFMFCYFKTFFINMLQIQTSRPKSKVKRFRFHTPEQEAKQVSW